MQDSISFKQIIVAILISFFILIFIFCLNYFDNRTTLVFCDVGQGDAIYLRINNRIDIVIDAGPNRKVLNCLGRYMPFYDRKIEYAILSHPQKDHYGGFFYLIDRYKMNAFFVSFNKSRDGSFNKLVTKLKDSKTIIKKVSAGDYIRFKTAEINFIWPKLIISDSQLNNYSLVTIFRQKNFRVLFCGDINKNIENELLSKPLPKINIIKIPHHGSKNGLTRKFFQLANPTIGVISVGKNNPYGHPANEILTMLKALNIKIRRTDEEGDVVFKISNIKN